MTTPARALIGRDHELQVLGDLLDGACAGSPRFAFVTGEPGIGKTSLLAELVGRAEERGCLALQGSAAEFERELPFGLVVDAFDEYLESLDPRAFNRLAAEDLGELASVFPALRSLDPGSNEPTTAAQRYRAHRAVRALLERLAASHPLVLVLDDLHWADGASLELVSHLLRRPPHAPVMVVGTFRTGQAGHGLEAAIDTETPGVMIHHLALGPLARVDADALVGGGDAPALERLYRASGGNPFYLLQLARLEAGDAPGSSPAGDAAGVPPAVAAAIAGELDRLAPPARRLADAAAVTGDPFELDLAVATAGMSEPEALAALDELVARDLVRSATVPRRFGFRHPLVRRAVYESCAPGSRIAAHGRCAAALAARGAPAAARAHHVEHSSRHGDMAAIGVLREAGAETARRAPESAARWFDIALRLLPESAPPGERVELLTALAGAQAATGRFEDSRAALLESISLTPVSAQARRVTLVGACAAVEQLLGCHEEAHARLAEALEEVSDASSPRAVELMIHLAVGDFYRMDYAGMRDWGERALAAAQPRGDLPFTAASTAVLAVAGAISGALPEAEAYQSQGAALVDTLPDEELALRLDALANLSTAELYLHRYEEAAAHARRGLSIARATGQWEISPVLIPVLSASLQMRGRVAESAELLEGAVEAARISGNAQALGWNLLSRAFTAVAAGDVELALNVARESVEITRDLDDSLVSTYASLALAEALFEAGDPAHAIDVLVTGTGGEELPLIPGGWRVNYFELLTRCRLALRQPVEAEHAAARAVATSRLVGITLATAMAHRATAAVALERGDATTAAAEALDAVAAADEIGARVVAAVARTLAGRALVRAGDRERGTAELARAAEQLDACGAVRHRNQAERELRRLGRHIHRRTRPGRADAEGFDALTRREQEIARLVLDRHTNTEIASELVLSVKTIETHMRNIFRKLDVSSRVEVARALERAGASTPS